MSVDATFNKWRKRKLAAGWATVWDEGEMKKALKNRDRELRIYRCTLEQFISWMEQDEDQSPASMAWWQQYITSEAQALCTQTVWWDKQIAALKVKHDRNVARLDSVKRSRPSPPSETLL